VNSAFLDSLSGFDYENEEEDENDFPTARW
jgi:hypothetical protein